MGLPSRRRPIAPLAPIPARGSYRLNRYVCADVCHQTSANRRLPTGVCHKKSAHRRLTSVGPRPTKTDVCRSQTNQKRRLHDTDVCRSQTSAGPRRLQSSLKPRSTQMPARPNPTSVAPQTPDHTSAAPRRLPTGARVTLTPSADVFGTTSDACRPPFHRSWQAAIRSVRNHPCVFAYVSATTLSATSRGGDQFLYTIALLIRFFPRFFCTVFLGVTPR